MSNNSLPEPTMKSPRSTALRRRNRPLHVERLDDRALLAGDFGWVVPLEADTGFNQYGSIRTTAVDVDSAGNTVTVGWMWGTGDFDPSPSQFLLTGGNGSGFVAKYNPQGNLLWATVFSQQTGATSVDIDASGSIYVTGAVGSAPATIGTTLVPQVGSYLAKIDPAGVMQWVTGFGTGANNVVVDSQGRSNVLANDGSVSRLSQFDSQGVQNWTVTTTNTNNKGIATDALDNIYIGKGSSGSIAKYSPSGGLTWSRAFTSNTGGSATLHDLTVDSAGNVYATGSFVGTVDFDPGKGKVSLRTNLEATFVAKLTTAGNFAWAKTLVNGPSSSYRSFSSGFGIDLDDNNNVYVVGGYTGVVDFNPGNAVANRTSTNPGNYNHHDDSYIVKLNSAGDFQFVEVVGGTAYAEEARDVVVTAAGSIKIAGRLVDANFDFDPDPIDTYFVAMQYPTPANLTRYQSYLLSLIQTP